MFFPFIELRLALSLYQDDHMLLHTLAGYDELAAAVRRLRLPSISAPNDFRTQTNDIINKKLL